MALMGRAIRRSPHFASTREDAPDPLAGMRFGSGKSEDNEKQAYTWLKDAYTFAKNNKEYLDNPEVQEILQAKLGKLEKAGFFSPVYKPKEAATRDMGTMPDGTPYAVGGPGAGSEGQMQVDYLGSLEAMYDRFKQENPSLHKPETQATMNEQGQLVERTYDPLAPAGAQTRDVIAPPTKMGEGESLGFFGKGPKGEPQYQPFYEKPKTFAPPTPKTQYGIIELDPKTGRWGQFSDAGKFEPIMTAEELAAKAKGDSDRDIPNSVYNNNFNNALKDAYEKANPDQKAWIGKRIWNWFFGSDPEAFEDLIQPHLKKYNDYYRTEQGKKAPASQPSAPKRKPLSAHFGASAPASTQSKVFKPES